MEQYPPPGRWVEVAQHRMHLYCTGQGSPTVILEAQANSSALDWGFVQPPIAQWTRVCSYDRAGFGWSALGEPPRTAEREAAELHTLLNTALWHASYEEARMLDVSDEQVAAIDTLGDIPLVVIRHGKSMFGSFPPPQATEMEQNWIAFQYY